MDDATSIADLTVFDFSGNTVELGSFGGTPLLIQMLRYYG
jgi:hypothetical protein